MRPRIFLPALLACIALPCSAADWQKAFPVTGKSTVRVETNDASVHVTGSDTREVRVHVSGTGYRIGNQIRISERSGNRVEVEVRVPHKAVVIGISMRSVNIDVAVPRDSDLEIHTGDGRIEVTGVEG